MAEVIEWRKLSVRRDGRFESLEEQFCSTKGAKTDNRVFATVKELMVFAALVGYQLDDYQPLESKIKTTPILLETYANTGHDSYIYLIALTKKSCLDILMDEHLKDAIEIFEGYCNSGLKHIDNWIINNIGEPLVTNILFDQTLNFLIDNE